MVNKFVLKASEGSSLSEKETLQLASFLGLRISLQKILSLLAIAIIYSFFLALFFGLFDFLDHNIPYLVTVSILSFLAIMYATVGFFKNRISDYYTAVAQYADKLFDNHQEMKKTYTWFMPNPTSYLKKRSVFFCTDGYYFMIKEDFLMSTGFLLGKKFMSKYNSYPMLKIFDPDSLEKREVTFKLSDIVSYQLCGVIVNEMPHEEMEEYMHVFEKQIQQNLVVINFKDFSSMAFGSNIFPILKNLIPLREEIPNE